MSIRIQTGPSVGSCASLRRYLHPKALQATRESRSF
nr:MAG TPA: hypothetical protein [Caudoviricetes sp.]